MPEKNIDIVKDVNTSNKTGIDVAKDPVVNPNPKNESKADQQLANAQNGLPVDAISMNDIVKETPVNKHNAGNDTQPTPQAVGSVVVQKSHETRWNPETKKVEPYFGPTNKVKDGSRSWDQMKEDEKNRVAQAAIDAKSKPVDVKPEAPVKK